MIKNYGFPYGYRKNQLCIYSVVLPQGYRLKINITNLELGINYVEYFFTGLKFRSRKILQNFLWLHSPALYLTGFNRSNYTLLSIFVILGWSFNCVLEIFKIRRIYFPSCNYFLFHNKNFYYFFSSSNAPFVSPHV